MIAGDLSVGQKPEGSGDPRRAPRGRRVTPTAMPTPPNSIPWADLLAAPFTAKSKVRNIKTGASG
jgi:hypothetical protein